MGVEVPMVGLMGRKPNERQQVYHHTHLSGIWKVPWENKLMLPSYMIGHLFAQYDTVPNTTEPLVIIVVLVVDDGSYYCVTHTLSLYILAHFVFFGCVIGNHLFPLEGSSPVHSRKEKSGESGGECSGNQVGRPGLSTGWLEKGNVFSRWSIVCILSQSA